MNWNSKTASVGEKQSYVKKYCITEYVTPSESLCDWLIRVALVGPEYAEDHLRKLFRHHHSEADPGYAVTLGQRTNRERAEVELLLAHGMTSL